MLKTLLRSSADLQKYSNAFLLYIVSASYQKMNDRMARKDISETYKACLLDQRTFAFKSPTIKMEHDSDHDESFIEVIPDLAKNADTKIPNLAKFAITKVDQIYNESTYMEFHLLLCELLTNFSQSLHHLVEMKKAETASGKRDVAKIVITLKNVAIFGNYLRRMVRSSAIEAHLQNIAHLLVVDSRKSWTPESEEDVDLVDFQRLKPYSMRKGKPLSPWESYRDWLRLMVHYFDASKVLTVYFSSMTNVSISVKILSPPLPSKEMLSWTDLLATEHFFPAVPKKLSGKDLSEFLTNSYNAEVEVLNSALLLKGNLELDVPTSDILTEIDTLAQAVVKCTSIDLHVSENILALKDFGPQVRQTKMGKIVESLSTLSNGATFYANLKQGQLHTGKGFNGKYHCEAYIASILALFNSSGQYVDDFKGQLETLTEQGVKQMKVLLLEIEASHFSYIA
jgi:hypothetical protein